MRTTLKFSLSLLAMAVLAACASKRKPDVWDMYDVRHPVPADSSVPVSQATQYDQYIDNDEYYIPPDAYQMDPD
jgi:hypothetical protein